MVLVGPNVCLCPVVMSSSVILLLRSVFICLPASGNAATPAGSDQWELAFFFVNRTPSYHKSEPHLVPLYLLSK